MSFRYVAGVVGKTVTPSGPYQNSTAPGVWSLAGQANFKAQSLWPTAGSVAPTQLWSWGFNSGGQLGLGNVTSYSSPKQVGALTTWQDIAGGGQGTSVAAIKTDGTLWTWGRNDIGQLGLDNTVARSSPVQVGALTNWLSIASGYFHMLATKTDGTLWAWGMGDYGQLGFNNTTRYSSPKQVGALTTWRTVAAGSLFSLATKTDGTLWAWGQNSNGQLGTGNLTYRSSPVQVGALTTWYQVAGGGNFTIATKTDGTLWAWGANNAGQLGTGNLTYRSSPVQVGALTTWYQVAGGGNYFSVATKTDGTLWSWGQNNTGQLGLGDTTSRSSPVQVGALNTWLNIRNGHEFALAIKTDGTLWGWGNGSSGQLGQGNATTTNTSPLQVGLLTTWTRIAATVTSTIAIKNP